MNRFQSECRKQLALKERWEAAGLTLLEDPFSLREKVGTVQTVPVVLEGITPKGLYKFFIQGEPTAEAFHLVAPERLGLHQDLTPGTKLEAQFVIGVRKVGSDNYVISLRMPPL